MMRAAAPLLVAMMLAPLVAARAQATGTLEGSVRTASGDVARAQVTAVDTLTNQRRVVESSARGYFRMLDLGPGRYAVTARLIGYAAVTRSIRLGAGERGQLDFVLPTSATMLDPVTVHDRAGPSTIARMSVSTTLAAEDIQRLPLNTRNVMDLAAVAPGIRTFQLVAGHALPAAGALRDERGINLYVDGVEMKNMNSTNAVGSPQSGSLLPVDAVEEFTVLLNPYDAEYARAAAYTVSAVTRRGSNETHGSLFGYFQDKGLVSVTDYQRGIPNFAKPDFDRQQGGFTLSGPVVRDRVFYAASYELSRTHNYVAVIPGQPASDPAMWNGFAGVFAAPNRNGAGLLRLTVAANDAHTVEAIWSSRSLRTESGFGGTEARESAVELVSRVNTVNLRHRWLPLSGLANEASVQVVRWTSDITPLFAGPRRRYPTLGIGTGDAPSGVHELQVRAVDRVVYAIGSGPQSHLLKAGVEIGHVTADQLTPTSSEGVFRFTTETGNPSDATIGMGFLDPLSRGDALATLSGVVAGVYVNDEWHPTSRLVLNLGVRYDAEIGTMNNDFVVPWLSDTALASRSELQGLLNRGDRRDDLNNVSPRVSFSWDAAGNRRLVVRGGFGIMFDRVPGFVPFGERLGATWRTYTFTNPGTLDPDELRRRVLAGSGTPAPPAVSLLPQRMDVPENHQWSVGLGAQLTPALALNLDFVQHDVRHLYTSVNVNWTDGSQTPSRRVLVPAYGTIAVSGDFARARYRALLTSLSYRPDTAVVVTLAHTLASAMADWDGALTNVPAAVATEFYTMQRTSGDERHRVVLSGGWTLARGISLSTVAIAASPRPYRTQVGQDVNRNGVFDDDWIDGMRYGVPPNAWRNWYRVVDVRITKSIAAGRGTRVELTAEAFNLFNTENYSGYFGDQRTRTGELRPDFGSPSGVFATRQLQLGSRLRF